MFDLRWISGNGILKFIVSNRNCMLSVPLISAPTGSRAAQSKLSVTGRQHIHFHWSRLETVIVRKVALPPCKQNLRSLTISNNIE